MRIAAGKANSNRSKSFGRNFIILKSKSVRPQSASVRQSEAVNATAESLPSANYCDACAKDTER